MNKFSKEKKSQLLMVFVLTAAAVAGLWFGLINVQQRSLQNLAGRKDTLTRKLDQMKQVIKTAPKIEADLEEASAKLTKLEADMATGDLYSWAINKVREFKAGYKVEIPQFSQIDGPKDVNILPGFPYKQAGLVIAGTAQFYDFGRFVADFENRFPYSRLLNLNLEPASGANPNDAEKLNFKIEIVTLVKPANS